MSGTLDGQNESTYMVASQHLDQHTPEEAIAEFVDLLKQSPERRDLLVQLLYEQSSFYEGRSANATIRIRGYILASFEQTGLPDTALPFVLEELESGRDAYLVAAAAKALRGLANPISEAVPFLLKAVENIKDEDDTLTFEQYKPRWPLAQYTTALTEIFQTLGWLGSQATSALPHLEALRAERCNEFSPRARVDIERAIDRIRMSLDSKPSSCCADSLTPITLVEGSHIPYWTGSSGIEISLRSAQHDHISLADVELEDQDGNVSTYSAFFGGKPSIVVFFYTRCDNPNKCSLTITKLAMLQKAIIAAGLEGLLRTAAITYDPEFDLPPRLKAYGLNRGVVFSDSDRIFRTRIGFQELRDAFQLGVNFGGPTVNRHTIELFILDSQGEIAVTFSRFQWDVHEVLEHARELIELG